MEGRERDVDEKTENEKEEEGRDKERASMYVCV